MTEVEERLIELLSEEDVQLYRTADLYCKTLASFEAKDYRKATILFMCIRWDGWCKAHFPRTYPPTDVEIEEGVEKAIAWAMRQPALAMRLH